MSSCRRDDTRRYSNLCSSSFGAVAESVTRGRGQADTVTILEPAVGPAQGTRAVAAGTKESSGVRGDFGGCGV
jgi:hypothetical protein